MARYHRVSTRYSNEKYGYCFLAPNMELERMRKICYNKQNIKLSNNETPLCD